jgi:hypothetical protein
LRGRDTITFRGSGQEADENGGTIVAYRWESSLDGELSTQAEFTMTASSLSTGTHTIYFQVRDDERDWSRKAWRRLTVTDQPFDSDVFIVTNRERLAALYGASEADRVMQRLDQLAVATNGLVIQVEDDPATAAAYTDWIARPTSFVHANRVADAIHDQIVAQLSLSPDAAYIVIAGDDRVVPFRRVRDRTDHPEHHYREVPATTTTGAALAADRTLTDDFYGDRVPTRLRGNEILYVPNMAVGRLVETPDEIIGQVDWFSSDGEIQVGEAIVTGYDFLVDGAQEMCSALVADGLFPDCGLIGNSWTATQFINDVLNRRHEFVTYNGHADHYTIYTPYHSVSSSQVGASTGDHAGALVWTLGCHGALNVPPGTAVELDMAQAWVSRQSLVVGNTGYGWGYTTGVGLSEQLMLDYTRQLLTGPETTAGAALVAAKQQYYLEDLDFDAYDAKILIEATLYGIPMARITSPDPVLKVDSAPSRSCRTNRQPSVRSTGYFTTVSKHYDFPALTAETTDHGTYYACGGQVERADGSPIQPRHHVPLSPPSTATATAPHGVVVRGAQGQTLDSVDPVVEDAVWEIGTGGSELDFDADAWFPDALLQLNRVAGRNELVFGAGQFHGVSETQRLYGAMDVDVYFTLSDDWDAPLIHRIGSVQRDDVVTVTVEAEDPSGLHGIVVAYSAGDGNWSSVDLDLAAGVWSGTFPGDAATEFIVQVVDGAGNVTAFTREGRYMRPGDSYRLRRAFLPLVIQSSP